MIGGTLVNSPMIIRVELLKHFKNLFGKFKLQKGLVTELDKDNKEMLVMPFTLKEVEDALGLSS